MLKIRDNLSQVFITTVLLLLVIYTGWLIHHMNSAVLAPAQDNTTPDYFAKNVYVIETNESGQIHNTFTSTYIEHFTQDDTAYYTLPHVISYPENGKQPWDITANKGKSINGNTQLILIDNVKIHEPAGNKNADTWITTSELTIYPHQNYAENDQPVTFTEPGLTINSIGMKVFFKEKRVELLNQARGAYDEKQTDKNKSLF